MTRITGVTNQPPMDPTGAPKANPSADAKKAGEFRQMLARQVQGASATQVDNAGIEALPSHDADRDTQLRWAAQQLESIYLQELFAAMRKTVPEGGFFKKDFTTRTYEEMLDTEQAKGLAQAGGVGLAEVLLRQMRGEE